jgi:hypothetical protein
MNLFRKPKYDRRRPENQEQRKRFDTEQKLQTQQTLADTQLLAEETGLRIAKLRRDL